MISQAQFEALVAKGYNTIPVARTILADMETPLSAYYKLAVGAYSFLFESVHGGEKWGRYSIIGLPARRWMTAVGNVVSLFTDGELAYRKEVENPLAFVEQMHARFNSAPIDGLPVFHGGLVGYFSYDTMRYVEPKLAASSPPDVLETPDILLMIAEEVLVFDNLAGTLTMVVNANVEAQDFAELDVGDTEDIRRVVDITQVYARAVERLGELEDLLPNPYSKLEQVTLDATSIVPVPIEERVEFTTSRAEFEAWVERIKAYIFDGDVMQVVPSQRMSVDFNAAPISLYRALRNLNPSPYMYFLDMDDFQIVGSSPEILVRAEQGQVTVRPIAGTRKRGKTDAEDKLLAEDLLADPKEIAEHVMLIDLGRNDIGRVAQAGTIELTENMVVERYSHVMHIVTNIIGQIREDFSAIDALRATLPAGTLSGAPKIRAMEIIDELESVKRGIYGGAVGHLNWAGDMDTAIAIRTAVIKDGKVHIQAGAGIVADSVPALEWEETMNKARAILRAVAMLCNHRE